jgi:hypothetical protein
MAIRKKLIGSENNGYWLLVNYGVMKKTVGLEHSKINFGMREKG